MIREWPLFLVALVLSPAACAGAGVVGGECRPGYCEPELGDAAADFPTLDGSADGNAPSGSDGAPRDATPRDDADANSTSFDGAADASDAQAESDACTPPFNTPAHCGSCEITCSDLSPICALIAGEYSCMSVCSEPLEQCGSQCVDTHSDPDHCGKCFNGCPSGICQAGQCVGAKSGHIVLACMSYEQSLPSSPQTVLLGNAVFLSFQNPVRILAYDQYAAPSAVHKVNQTVSWAAQAKGRSFSLTSASTSAEVVADLSVIDYDVFIVYEQPNAPPAALASLGSAWFTTLEAFVKAGGTVVVLNGGNGIAEMGAFLTNAGLLPVTGETQVTGSTLHNNLPTDAIGINVISPFLALERTCTFATSVAPGPKTAFVITDAPAEAGAPVVVHRVP